MTASSPRPLFLLQDTVPELPFSLNAYLWLAGAVLLLVGLVAVFAYLLLRRYRDWLGELYRKLDLWLTGHVPRGWLLLKGRFSYEQWYGLALTAATVVVVAGLFVFGAIAEGWTDQEALYRIDQAVNRAIDGAVSASVTQGFRRFTDAGGVPVAVGLGVVLALGLALKRWWRHLVALLLAVGGGEVVLWTLKWIFSRERPGTRTYTPVGASFPSGHAFTATVLYGFLIYLVWQFPLGRPLQIALTTLLTALILGIGLSRIVLNVHWLSDVLGGLTMGLAWLVFSLVLARGLAAYRQRRLT